MDAGREGGVVPAAFNAANEVAVAAFLEGALAFPDIAEVVSVSLERLDRTPLETLADVRRADREARRLASGEVERRARSRSA